jgi:hypothetical protein
MLHPFSFFSFLFLFFFKRRFHRKKECDIQPTSKKKRPHQKGKVNLCHYKWEKREDEGIK